MTKTPDNVAFAFLLFQFPSEVRFRRFCDSTADSSVCVCVCVCVAVCVCVCVCVSPSFLLTVSNENLSGIDVILGGDWWIVIGGILIGLLPWLTPSFIPAFFFLFSSIFPPFFLHFSSIFPFPLPPPFSSGRLSGDSLRSLCGNSFESDAACYHLIYILD